MILYCKNGQTFVKSFKKSVSSIYYINELVEVNDFLGIEGENECDVTKKSKGNLRLKKITMKTKLYKLMT